MDTVLCSVRTYVIRIDNHESLKNYSQRVKVQTAIKLAPAMRSPGFSVIPLLPLLPTTLVADGLAVFAAGLTVLGWLDASRLLEAALELACYHIRGVTSLLAEVLTAAPVSDAKEELNASLELAYEYISGLVMIPVGRTNRSASRRSES